MDSKMLCDRLKKERKINNYSQEQIAEILGVSRQTIVRWENGTSSPSIENLKILAELYNTSINSLIDSEDSNLPLKEEKPNPTPSSDDTNTKPINIYILLFLTIISSLICPLGIITAIYSIIWSRNKNIPKLFLVIFVCCLLVDLWNGLVLLNTLIFKIGYDTTITPIG